MYLHIEFSSPFDLEGFLYFAEKEGILLKVCAVTKNLALKNDYAK